MPSKSAKSRTWLNRHNSDPYVKAAREHNYRGRAAYKLQELDAKHNLLKPARVIIDLGSAPGSWSQVVRINNSNAHVIACDLLPMPVIDKVQFIQGDFQESEVVSKVAEALDGQIVDLILSDMAPNLSGNQSADQAAGERLAAAVMAFAEHHLHPRGSLLYKCFHGTSFEAILGRMRQSYGSVKICKPKASRQNSREVYVLARGLKTDSHRCT